MASDTNCGVRFPPKKNKNRTCSSVPGCTSKAINDVTVRFHRFPAFGQHFIKKRNIHGEIERIDRAELWMNVLNIPRNRISKYTIVCSLHFQRDDYLLPNVPAKKKFLKSIAVPSCNLPGKKQTSETAVDAQTEKNDQTKKQETRVSAANESNFFTVEMTGESWVEEVIRSDAPIIKMEESPFQEGSTNGNNFCTVNIKEEPSFQEVNESDLPPVKMEELPIQEFSINGSNFCTAEIKEEPSSEDFERMEEESSIQVCSVNGSVLPAEEIEQSSIQDKTESVKFVSVGTQVTSGDLIVKYSDLIDSDVELDKMTGILNFQILNRICDAVDATYRGERKSVMSTKDKVIMTFMKLKHNFSYTVLSSLFKCVQNSRFTKILFQMLTKLNNVLKQYAVPFPNKEKVENDRTAKVRAERSKQCLRTFKILGYKMPKNLVQRSAEIETIICAIINMNNEYC